MKRALILANPESGSGAAFVTVEETLQVCTSAGGWEPRVAWTEIRGHGVLLAQAAAAEGVELVIVVGGDGTVREAAAGLVDTPSVLAIAPAGTGNSSYRELYEDSDWREVLVAALSDLRSRRVDLARVEPTGEYSLLGVSAGWFAQVVRIAKGPSEESGRARYAAAAQAAAAAPESFSATVTLDRSEFAAGDLGLVAVGGARRRGGVFPVLPDSSMEDGLLDVLAVRACGPEDFSRLLGLVLQGVHGQDPLARLGRGRSLTLTSGMPLPLEVDGDLWDRDIGRCEISVAPAALAVVPALP